MYKCLYVCRCQCVSLYINMYLYFSLVNISIIPSWYIVLRGQTYSRWAQACSYYCHITVNKIANVVTISAYLKYITGFKIIWNTSSKITIKKMYFSIDCLKVYVIWHLTSSIGDWFEDIYPFSTGLNLVFSTSVKLFSQLVCLSVCLYIPLFLTEI